MTAKMSENIIIQVGGTAFSGSTLLDLMLSNDEHAFSCGEMSNLFEPSREQHFDPYCSCLDDQCNFWQEVKLAGTGNIWRAIQKHFPEATIFVDSSKNVEWFKRIQNSEQANCSFRNVLIWKTPAEYAYSCLKRGRVETWQRSYVNYHLNFFNNFREAVSVCYSELVESPAVKLEKICDVIGLPYFQGKENYWTREYHTLFGSSTAKLHLYEIDSGRFRSIVADKTKHESMMEANIQRAYKFHRKFFPADKTVYEKLPHSIQKEINTSSKVRQIYDLLRATEVESSVNSKEISSLITSIKPYRPPLQQRILNRLKRYLRIR